MVVDRLRAEDVKGEGDGPQISDRIRARTAFVRWQGRTVQQIGVYNNVLIVLASGAVALVTSLLFNEKIEALRPLLILLIGAAVLFLSSLVLGLLVMRNRLQSFRATMRITRLKSRAEPTKRTRDEKAAIEEARCESKWRDRRTFRLLNWEAAIFFLGVVVAASTAVIAVSYS